MLKVGSASSRPLGTTSSRWQAAMNTSSPRARVEYVGRSAREHERAGGTPAYPGAFAIGESPTTHMPRSGPV